MFNNRFIRTPHTRLYDKVILIVACVFTIVMSGFSFVSYSKSKESQIESEINNLKYYTDEIKVSIENDFNKNFEFLEYIRTFPEVYNMDWQEQYNFLKGQEKYLDFEHLFIMDLEGNGYYVNDNIIKNQREEEFYTNVMFNDRYITEPFMEYYQNRSITTLSVPIYKDINKVGVLCGVIDLSNIYKIFENAQINSEGYSFIINAQGEYVAHTDMSLVHNKNNIFDELKDNKENIKFFKESINNNKEVIDKIEINNKKYYANITPLKSNEWYVVFVIPENEVLAPVNKFARVQVCTIIFGIISILISIKLIIRGFENNKLAYTDSLTKINNRASINIILEKLENNKKVDISIVNIDLNDFKYINDTFGHQTGDILLSNFAKILSQVFKREAFIGRMGGDEFIIILINKSDLEIEIKINEIERRIEEYNKFSKNKLAISYGNAKRKAGQDISLNDIYKKADDNMYIHKNKVKIKYGE